MAWASPAVAGLTRWSVTVPGSARPAHSVGGLSKARPGSVPDNGATRPRSAPAFHSRASPELPCVESPFRLKPRELVERLPEAVRERGRRRRAQVPLVAGVVECRREGDRLLDVRDQPAR